MTPDLFFDLLLKIQEMPYEPAKIARIMVPCAPEDERQPVRCVVQRQAGSLMLEVPYYAATTILEGGGEFELKLHAELPMILIGLRWGVVEGECQGEIAMVQIVASSQR